MPKYFVSHSKRTSETWYTNLYRRARKADLQLKWKIKRNVTFDLAFDLSFNLNAEQTGCDLSIQLQLMCWLNYKSFDSIECFSFEVTSRSVVILLNELLIGQLCVKTPHTFIDWKNMNVKCESKKLISN